MIGMDNPKRAALTTLGGPGQNYVIASTALIKGRPLLPHQLSHSH